MQINKHDLEVFTPPCNSGAERFSAVARLTTHIRNVLAYLNAARRYGTVYVPWEMWNNLQPASQEFAFYIQDNGRFRIEFDAPIRWLLG